MRNLPATLTAELNLEWNRIGHVIELVFSTVNPNLNLYYTDIDDNVVWDSNQGFGVRTYFARGIEFNNTQYSLLPKVDNLSFEIDNVALEISSAAMNNETRGKQCNIYRAAFGHSAHSNNKNPFSVIGATPLFIGYLDSVEVNAHRGSFEVLNHFQRWKVPTPRRKYGARCPWTFKDPITCRYTGAETTCDKSWDRCTTLVNTPNNGGNRWIAALQDKNVPWGRV